VAGQAQAEAVRESRPDLRGVNADRYLR